MKNTNRVKSCDEWKQLEDIEFCQEYIKTLEGEKKYILAILLELVEQAEFNNYDRNADETMRHNWGVCVICNCLEHTNDCAWDRLHKFVLKHRIDCAWDRLQEVCSETSDVG